MRRRDVMFGTLLAAGLFASAACKPRGTASSSPVRCAHCGMRVEPGSHWAAGAVDANGHPLAFDTPGCLLRFRAGPRGGGVRDEWVIEYYGLAEAHTRARDVRYVVGSDVIGPMGPDAVPVRADRAEQFRSEHKGTRVLTFEEAGAALGAP